MRLIDADEAKANVAKLIIGASEFAQDTRNAAYEAIDAAPTIAQAARSNPNPLTLDELQERNGNPVWTVMLDNQDSGQWEICKYNLYDHSSYGVRWVAYDYPPKEDV